MNFLYLSNDAQLLNKSVLKRFKTALADLDIKNDFIELSTMSNGLAIQVRIFGQADRAGELHWQVVRIVNQSIIPAAPSILLSNN